MQNDLRRFRLTDGLLLALTLLPIVCGMAIKILFVPPGEGMDIAGAAIFFTIHAPLQELPITESQVNSWLVVLLMLFFSLWVTHGIRTGVSTKRQLLAEWVVEKTDGLVNDNMGPFFAGFSPLVGAVLALSACSSLLTLFGLFPPTSDLNVVGGWAIFVFFLITYYKLRCGPDYYLKSFAEPVSFLAPMNVISELATPVSMAFRHFGNVLSGVVISTILGAALQGLTASLLGWLPGVLGQIPFLQIGIPAVLSIYFDLFSGCLQAFIFAMLTMLYVANAFSLDVFQARQNKKKKIQSVS